MNIKRLAICFLVVVVMVAYIACVRHGQLLRRSLQVGDLDWIYRGDNTSEIQFNGRPIIGPCRLEIMEDNDFVYGNSDEDSPWFVIDKNTHHVARGNDFNSLCRAMGVVCPIGRLRLETFLTRWNRVEQ